MIHQTWSRYIQLAAGMGMIAFVLIGTSAGPAVAQVFKPLLAVITNDADHPVPVRAVASNLTHVGQPASELVHLRWVNTCFFGDQDPLSCYVHDNGKTFVITDVIWRSGSIIAPGILGGFTIIGDHGRLAYRGQAVADVNGSFGGQDHFQTGFLFEENLRPLLASASLDLYGYLVPNE